MVVSQTRGASLKSLRDTCRLFEEHGTSSTDYVRSAYCKNSLYGLGMGFVRKVFGLGFWIFAI